MKKLVLSLLILFGSTGVFAEDFIVVKVSGGLKVDGKEVKPGDKLKTGQKIVYSSDESRAVVWSSKRGRLILKKDATKDKSELELTLASLTNPPKGQLSTRSGAINNIIDLKNHFSKDKYLLLDSSGVKVNPNLFKQNESEFFFLRYTYNGEEINKALDNHNDHIILKQKDIFSIEVNNEDVDIDYKKVSQIKLFHYNSEKEESIYITDVNLIAPINGALKFEIDIILNSFDDNNSNKAKSEVNEYLSSEYGISTKSNFEDWYKKNCL